MSNYTLLEQETNINYNRFDEHAIVYTAAPSNIRKIEKLLVEYSDKVTRINSTDDSIMVKVPKNWVKINPPKKLSQLQIEHLKNMREKASLNN